MAHDYESMVNGETPLSDTIADSAARVQDQAKRVQDQAKKYGKKAVDAVDSSFNATADYLREHDAAEIGNDVQTFVKAHPMQALIGAVVVGFLAGRAARS